MREVEHNTRYAELSFSYKEEKLADRIIDLMFKTTCWTADGYEGMYAVPVEDKADYEDFVDWYKNAKRMFKACEKYGF